jgi:hypothetical protein
LGIIALKDHFWQCSIRKKNKKMKNKKIQGVFARGRKWVFTLALFVLVFAAASAMKIKAASNVTGYLWGGGDEEVVSGTEPPWDGTNTNVGWISMSSDNPELASFQSTSTKSYNVDIPENDGEAVTGYAWSEYLGWIDFNPQDSHCVEPPTVPSATQYQAADCDVPSPPGGSPGVFRSPGNKLTGWARIVGIAQESAKNNSGGWSGWIHMNGSTYGIDLAKMTGDMTFPKSASQMTFATAGEDELGWIDFSRAKAPCTPITVNCGTALSDPHCSGSSAPTANLCSSGGDVVPGTEPSGNVLPWKWQCVSNVCPGPKKDCEITSFTEPDNGECGADNGVSFCGKTVIPTNRCAKGEEFDFTSGYSEYTWTCGSTTCGGHPVSCSAPGNHCGWIETNQ